MTDKEPLCESCKHEKRYHVIPDKHVTEKNLNAQKLIVFVRSM